MAILTLVTPVYSSGNAEKTALYAVRNVTTGDSVDVGGDFSAPKLAVFICTTAGKKDVCSIVGTTCQISTLNLSGDAGYLLVYGSSQ